VVLAKEASPRRAGQYDEVRPSAAGAASCGQRRQPSAEPGSAVREPKAACGVRRGQLESNVIVLVTVSLVAFGMVMVYSATSASATIGGGNPTYYLKRQGIFALLGLGALVLASRWNYRALRHLAPTLVVGSLGLLLLALVAGSRVNGASRWLDVGGISFQPSELAKLTLGIWTALYLARRPVPRTLGELAKPIGLVTAVFCALVLAEPDLGTVIALCLMVGAMLVVAGAPMRMMGTAAAITGAVVLFAIWLEPYRRTRIFSFISPWHDAQGAGYQTVQAMVGLGSGGVFGRGLGESVAKVFYLPEAHTDMIFAIIGEELGLVGGLLVIAAYAAFAWAGMRIALRCRDPFGKALASGITTLVCAQAVLNLAAVVGMAPLTGIPLPLVSYGGTNLVVVLASVGILLNIARSDGVEVAADVRDRGRRHGRSRDAGARRRAGAPRPRRERQLRRLA
jgi:cell division protein FtsW